MKQICVALIGIVLMWFSPANSAAQGFLGSSGMAGPAEFPIRWPSSIFDSSDRAGRSLLEAPRVYFGWLEHPNGARWASHFTSLASTGTAQWPLKGFWLGVSEDLSLSDGLDLIVSASMFLPQRSAGAWFTAPLSETFEFDIPSYDWWAVDSLGRKRVSGPFELLAGFRWDHTSTRVNYRDNARDDYILNAYLPLVGLQVNQLFSSGSLLVRFIGTPVVWGKLRYHYWDQQNYSESGDFEVSSGYFGEFLVDYSRRMAGNLFAGGFVRWNSLSLKTAERNLSEGSTEPMFWTIRIQSWTIGGSLTLEFASPL